MQRMLCSMSFNYLKKTNKIKIKKNKLFLIHPLYFFDTRHKSLTTIDVSPRFIKSYSHMSHALAYFT